VRAWNVHCEKNGMTGLLDHVNYEVKEYLNLFSSNWTLDFGEFINNHEQAYI
jgi:hypothetical protein